MFGHDAIKKERENSLVRLRAGLDCISVCVGRGTRNQEDFHNIPFPSYSTVANNFRTKLRELPRQSAKARQALVPQLFNNWIWGKIHFC